MPKTLAVDYDKSIAEKRRLQTIRKMEKDDKEESDLKKREARLRKKEQDRAREDKDRAHRGVVVKPSDDLKKLKKAKKKQMKLLNRVNLVNVKEKNFFLPKK
jgi:hypothetical protein